MPKQLTNETLVGDILHEWTIQEYDQHERGVMWYIVLGTLAVLFIAYGIFSGNFLFALIIILAAVIIFLQSHQTPLQVLFSITELGVVVGSRFYPYSDFKDFYLIYQPPEVKTLFIIPQQVYRPMLRIPLLDKNPVEIRHTLREFLPEDTEKEAEPFSDTFARTWKIH
jgi:hypothetical protein